ncbi:MAG: Holliday junction resolvase RuvX [Chloroflexi bacterium]|nr:Holliday junction resolvase RuvX [Chloroflexota bacterium]
MRILALDVGEKRIGVAVSDPTETIAGTLTVLQRSKLAADLAAIARLVEAEAAEEVLVGLPITLEGEIGPQAQATLAFVEALRTALAAPVRTWDERFTTAQAQEILRSLGVRGKRQRRRIDATAAAVLLQGYLDSRRAGSLPQADGR